MSTIHLQILCHHGILCLHESLCEPIYERQVHFMFYQPGEIYLSVSDGGLERRLNKNGRIMYQGKIKYTKKSRMERLLAPVK